MVPGAIHFVVDLLGVVALTVVASFAALVVALSLYSLVKGK